jgi:hypothetical protein
VHTEGVAEEKLTASPDEAVAVTVYAALPTVAPVGEFDVMVTLCESWWTANDCCFCNAGS